MTFDGAQAALLYVSATQINAQFPASIAPGSVQVVLQSNGVSSAQFTVTGALTLPATDHGRGEATPPSLVPMVARL